jgi:hypothetical protein
MSNEYKQSEENIVISIDTSSDVNREVFDMNKLKISHDFGSEEILDTTMYVFNYNLNFNKQQLLQICDYYGIAKMMRQQKCNKDEIIMMLVDFEASEENCEIVTKRQLLWYYVNELKNDSFMKKYIFF